MKLYAARSYVKKFPQKNFNEIGEYAWLMYQDTIYLCSNKERGIKSKNTEAVQLHCYRTNWIIFIKEKRINVVGSNYYTPFVVNACALMQTAL